MECLELLFKLLPVAQPRAFDLVGYVIYDVEEKPYQSVLYNGTIEVVESGGLLSGESVFLLTLGIALLLLLGLWTMGIQPSTSSNQENQKGVKGGSRNKASGSRGTHLAKPLSGKSKSKKN